MSTTYYKFRDKSDVVHVAMHLPASEAYGEWDRRVACDDHFQHTADKVPQAEKGATITCLTCLNVVDLPVLRLLR